MAADPVKASADAPTAIPEANLLSVIVFPLLQQLCLSCALRVKSRIESRLNCSCTS